MTVMTRQKALTILTDDLLIKDSGVYLSHLVLELCLLEMV